MGVLLFLLQITVGKAEYQCSCVRYIIEDNTALIVGLSVSLSWLLLIIAVVVIAIILYRRRQSQQAEPAEMSNVDKPYNRRLPSDYRKSEMEDPHYRRRPPTDFRQDSEV